MSASPQGGPPTPSKLYVSNLSQAATLTGLRQLFGTCGDVLEVVFAAERNRHTPPSAAYVTMATSQAAERAIKDLHHRLHEDRVLMISRIAGGTGNSADATTRAARVSATEQPPVVMTQQYRDRHGLTYELSCSGNQVTLRFLFPVDDAHDWQVEARLAPSTSPPVTASAMTRERALQALVEAWTSQPAAPELDWEHIAAALRAVRAL